MTLSVKIKNVRSLTNNKKNMGQSTYSILPFNNGVAG